MQELFYVNITFVSKIVNIDIANYLIVIPPLNNKWCPKLWLFKIQEINKYV
jgi:hypothetical protein